MLEAPPLAPVELPEAAAPDVSEEPDAPPAAVVDPVVSLEEEPEEPDALESEPVVPLVPELEALCAPEAALKPLR